MPTSSSSSSPQPIRLFVAYAREDDAFRRKLLVTLADWKRQNLIADIWSDREIVPGKQWDDAIREALDAADLILVLMSHDSIASEYMASVEIVRALERHNRGEARVVPVVIRSCDWTSTPLGHLQAVPPGGKPLSKYADPDEFWLDVRNELKKVVGELRDARVNVVANSTPMPEAAPVQAVVETLATGSDSWFWPTHIMRGIRQLPAVSATARQPGIDAKPWEVREKSRRRPSLRLDSGR
jgi:hypothetical protein